MSWHYAGRSDPTGCWEELRRQIRKGLENQSQECDLMLRNHLEGVVGNLV